ncbi:hypothetical protein Ddye_008020 [Dipteronia dyeriana]|uniref:Uncharacterized protein n=1 Tax=Dipteronia dyeriana TaxID=168575 RepID=A0AAD9X9K4_9ROSI|nr:hypothetical protein Ddye_008020 [Dipteronia dyeriana]
MAKSANDASSELDQVSQGLNYRTKLVHDMFLSLPQDIVDVITEMAMDDAPDEAYGGIIVPAV